MLTTVTLAKILVSITFFSPFSVQELNTLPVEELEGFELKSGGWDREYFVHNSNPTNQSLPLLILFHGGGEDAAYTYTASHASNLAKDNELLIVLPNGASIGEKTTGYQWNAGAFRNGDNCCGRAYEHGVDDVSFINDMLDGLTKRFDVDTKKIYVAGFSNGAQMAYRYACEGAYPVAGVGLVSGSAALENWDECVIQKSIPVIRIAESEEIPTTHICGENFAEETLFFSPHGTTTRQTAYCSSGALVVEYILQGAGHAWNSVKVLTIDGTGKRQVVSKDATKIIWDFFGANVQD